MDTVIYERLKDVARQGKTITYGEIASLGNWDTEDNTHHNDMVGELEEIAEYETKAGRPLLVVLVIRGDRGMPGKGLFEWARKTGLQKDRDDIAFFVSELRRVYDFWESAPR